MPDRIYNGVVRKDVNRTTLNWSKDLIKVTIPSFLRFS